MARVHCRTAVKRQHAGWRTVPAQGRNPRAGWMLWYWRGLLHPAQRSCIKDPEVDACAGKGGLHHPVRSAHLLALKEVAIFLHPAGRWSSCGAGRL